MIPLRRLVPPAEIPYAEHGAFLLCSKCEQVHRVSGLDRAPIFGDDGSVHPVDDLGQFLATHAEHSLCTLRRSSEIEAHSHARHDPMRRVSWETVDADRHPFVVSFGRDDVESPRRYSVRPGRLVPVAESIDVDTTLLRAVVDEALYPHSAPASRLDRLAERCRALVGTIGWEGFSPIDEDREDPNTQLACLPRSVRAALAEEARTLFPGSAGERVAELLDHDLRAEIPVVRMRRQYVIESL